MNTTREQIYLAALLHDIGKFYQRADKNFSEKNNELSEYSKKMATDICPINDSGQFGYQHVVWTNEFFELMKETLNKLPGFKENYFQETNEDNISNLACNHHQPKTLIQAIISMADWWSSGIDRRNEISYEKEENPKDLKEINWGKTRYKNIPLYSIFNSIKVKKITSNKKFAFPLKPIDISENCFPKEILKVEDGVSQEKYNGLWDGFTDEFQKLPTDTLQGFSESLIYLLKKYTWCIPSNTMDMANVSLFDHLKTTAAFADCIYTYYLENKKDIYWNETDKRISLMNNKFPVILLGGDISGIQKFIYNISSRKAATSLKGRSFYLQLLIDSIIQRIIAHEDIQASLAHVVYSSGGKFYMILPYTEKVKKAIDTIYKDIERNLWEEHHGKLIFNMDFVPFAYRNNTNEIDFEDIGNEDKNLGSLWKTLAEKLTKKKNQKFNSLLINNFNVFFEVEKTGGEVDVCAVTGQELSKSQKEIIPKSDGVVVSKSVIEQIKLGNALKDIDYLITFKGDEESATYFSNRLKHKTTIFRVANYLFDKTELSDNEAEFRKISSADVSRVKTINNTEFLAAPLKGKSVSYGFQFYGGNKQAGYNQERDRTFEELTEVIPYDDKTETYFGVLRMDVDGLGEIFIKGLSEEDKSLSAYATLSSALDWFFSGYLNTIREKYKDNVNILYSGGDDVFAVGRWDLLIAFAEDIRKEFRKFTGREDISISAGLIITGNKYPIAKAAELAGEAENNAKKYISIDYGNKNAINLFGTTISWNTEFEWVKSKKLEFISLIENFGMSKGILHRLILFAEIKAENDRRKDDDNFVPDLSYHWNAAYYLKRYMDNKAEAVKEFCKTLQKELFEPRKMELIALAARWAELEIREILTLKNNYNGN